MSSIISSLHIYPVKSCGGIDLAQAEIGPEGLRHDREWMVVDPGGEFLTQRVWPAMARIRTALDAGTLTLEAPGAGAVVVPLVGPVDAPHREVRVWRDTVTARDEGDEVAAWLSKVLAKDCRLVRVDPQARRLAGPERVRDWMGRHPDLADGMPAEHHYGFADGYPFLVANQGSLDELNRRLQAAGHPPVPMNRFRPNIVVAGPDAFEEDATAAYQIGPLTFALVKPCTRCAVPDIDQVDGRRYDQPGRMLASFRNLESGIVFGQNAVVHGPMPARIAVGDAVEIVFDF